MDLEISNQTAAAARVLFDESRLLEEFLADQDVREGTKVTYRRSLMQFIGWMRSEQMTISDIHHADILRYKQQLFSDRRLSNNTINLYLTGVRKFFAYLEARRLYPNVARAVKSPKLSRKHEKSALTQSQVQQLLTYAESALSLRDFAIINLLVRTGLRTIEVSRATCGDLQTRGARKVLAVQGKGQDEKKQLVVLSDKAIKPIYRYLTQDRFECCDSEPLFTARHHDRMAPKTISMICKRALRATGLDSLSYSAHSLRHTAACHMLKAGAGIEDVRGVLRHSSADTTRLYLRTVEEELRLEKASELLLDDIF
ncbi:MAG: hypothetical protein EBR93_06425 [Bacteroidetes bacterium]|nr:hypothetical protein [Bacteroidota bacterium]